MEVWKLSLGRSKWDWSGHNRDITKMVVDGTGIYIIFCLKGKIAEIMRVLLK